MMSDITKQRMTIQLNVAQNDGDPSIFLWSVLPEHIIDLRKSTSGGTDVTVKLPNGEQVTHSVTQDIDQIKRAIEICKKTDDLSDLA